MKTKEEYEKELNIIDSIRKCVIRYAIQSSTENRDNTQSEWFKECKSYLDKRYYKIQNKASKFYKM